MFLWSKGFEIAIHWHKEIYEKLGLSKNRCCGAFLPGWAREFETYGKSDLYIGRQHPDILFVNL